MHDVIIIGAGAAGLAAARALSHRNLCIVEARDRIGGRIHTLHFNDLPLPIELGAEFIHGEAKDTFAIVDSAALLTYRLPDDHWWSGDTVWKSIDSLWQSLDQLLERAGHSTRDRSFEDFLRTQRLTPAMRKLARNFVEGYHAAHADRISAKTMSAISDAQFRIASGYDSLIDWLRAGLSPSNSFRLGSTVTEVRWKRGSVDVDCATHHTRETLRARAALITIPLGVWKAPHDQPGAIRFVPELRAKQKALDHLEVGHVVKITFRFREPFWKQPFNFVHCDDRFLPTWWTTAPARAPLLTGWAGGHAADALLAEGSDAMVDRAIDAMSRVFGTRRSQIARTLITAWTHDWQSDPFSRGAYSYAAVGGSHAHAELAKPIQSTLFFAGEATSSDQTGTVAGAIASGLRAARQIQ